MKRARHLFSPVVASLLVAGALAAPHTAAGQVPDSAALPGTWGPNGPARALAVAGEHLLVGGTFDYVGPPTGGFAVLGATDGRLAPSPNLPHGAGAVESDGAGGWFVSFGVDGGQLRHVLADGSLDPGWRAPRFNGTTAKLLRRGNALFVAGSFSAVDPRWRFDWELRPGLVALDTGSGALLPWTAGLYPHSGGSGVTNMALDGDTLYVVGAFSLLTPPQGRGMAAIDVDTGTVLDSAFPSLEYTGSIVSMSASDGRVYLSGWCKMTTGGPDQSLCGFNRDGTPLAGWAAPSGLEGTNGIVIATEGRLYIGSTAFSGDAPGVRIRGFSPLTGQRDGWRTRAFAGAQNVRAMALSGGRLFVSLPSIGALSGMPQLLAFDAATGSDVEWNAQVGGPVGALAVAGDRVAITGGFTSAGGARRLGLAAIDLRSGRLADVQPPALPSGVETLATQGDLAVAGGPGGLTAFSIASGRIYGQVSVDGAVLSLAFNDATLFVGGNFRRINGIARRHLAAVDLRTGVVTPWDPEPDNSVTRLIAANGALYAVGEFQSLPGYGRDGVAAFDLRDGAVLPFSPRSEGPVRDLAFYRDRVLLAGGVGRNTLSHGTQWVDRVTGDELPLGRPVPFLVNGAGRMGDVIVVGGQPTPGFGEAGLAAIDAVSGEPISWTPLIAGGFPAAISAAAVTADYVAVAGEFSHVDGAASANLAVFPARRAAVPRHMRARTVSSTVTIDWQSGGLPQATSYRLDVGTVPGGTEVGRFEVGAVRVTASLPPGTYYVRVRGVGRTGPGAAGSEVIVSVPALSVPPDAPSALRASVSSGVITLTWAAAAGNATTYVVEAGTAPGLTNIATVPLGHLDTVWSAPAPSGTYYVRVRAANEFGVSPPTNEVVVVVP